MSNQTEKRFSNELNESKSLETKLQQVGHPLIKQILNQTLAEEVGDSGYGSSFGEGPAG